jgi:hypothetical protein
LFFFGVFSLFPGDFGASCWSDKIDWNVLEK